VVNRGHEARHVHARARSPGPRPSLVQEEAAGGKPSLDLIRRHGLRSTASGAARPKRRARLRREVRRPPVLGFIEHRRRCTPPRAPTRLRGTWSAASCPPRPMPGVIAMPAEGRGTARLPIPARPAVDARWLRVFRQARSRRAAQETGGLEMIPEFDQFPVLPYFTKPPSGDRPPAPCRVRPKTLRATSTTSSRRRSSSAARATRPHRWRNRRRSDLRHDDHERLLRPRRLQMQEMLLSLGPAKGKRLRRRRLGPYLVHDGRAGRVAP